MAMTSAEKQAARRERLKGLQVTVTLTPEAKAALDSLMAQGLTQSQAISEALGNFDILLDLKDGGDVNMPIIVGSPESKPSH